MGLDNSVLFPDPTLQTQGGIWIYHGNFQAHDDGWLEAVQVMKRACLHSVEISAAASGPGCSHA